MNKDTENINKTSKDKYTKEDSSKIEASRLENEKLFRKILKLNNKYLHLADFQDVRLKLKNLVSSLWLGIQCVLYNKAE